MRSTRATCSKVLLLLSCAGAFAETPPAHEFSADIVSRDATGAATDGGGRMFVSNGKVRIEPTNTPAGFFLIDGAAATSLFVRPAQQVFMDARQSSRLTQIFLPVDPNVPCSQWQAAARNAGVPNAGGDWHCERIDTAPVDGHDITIQYAVVSPNRESTQRWIDTALDFPVKLRQSDGATLALEHIRVEPQPASLFTVPASYRKSDPQALIDRIKQSDVWVEPAK
jgi:hypothetical protein